MEFTQAVSRRRMVRNYAPEEVDEETIRRILLVAQHGPSAGFTQGQRLIVVTDAERRAAIAELAGESEYVQRGFDPWISRAPVLIVVCTSESEYRRRYTEPDKRRPYDDTWPIPYWWVDAGATLMLLLLAAVDEGLGAGFLGVDAIDAFQALLSLPMEVIPIGVVTMGYPAPDRRSSSLVRGHIEFEEFVHRNKW